MNYEWNILNTRPEHVALRKDPKTVAGCVFQESQLSHIWLKLSRSEGDRLTFSGTHLWYTYVDVSNIGQYLTRRQEIIMDLCTVGIILTMLEC